MILQVSRHIRLLPSILIANGLFKSLLSNYLEFLHHSNSSSNCGELVNHMWQLIVVEIFSYDFTDLHVRNELHSKNTDFSMYQPSRSKSNLDKEKYFNEEDRLPRLRYNKKRPFPHAIMIVHSSCQTSPTFMTWMHLHRIEMVSFLSSGPLAGDRGHF